MMKRFKDCSLCNGKEDERVRTLKTAADKAAVSEDLEDSVAVVAAAV
jgi:hypothetical protein